MRNRMFTRLVPLREHPGRVPDIVAERGDKPIEIVYIYPNAGVPIQNGFPRTRRRSGNDRQSARHSLPHRQNEAFAISGVDHEVGGLINNATLS